MNIENIYEQCYMIRAFEKKVEKEFEKGVLRGTTHGCIGQEVIPVLLMQCIDRDKDYITGTHRCHGQVLAYTNDPYRLACEMMGKKDGYNSGMGGSQHIKIDKYITNGVTGGMAAVGCGMAMSLKKNRKEGIVISFLGDGGFQEGYVQEAINMAQIYQVPILYILENNRYAMSTKTSDFSAGQIKDRIEALGMAYKIADARNIDVLPQQINDAYAFVKAERQPLFLEIDTFRLCGHSKSDEREYMSGKEKESNIKDDPVRKLRYKISEETINSIESRLDSLIEEAFIKAREIEEIGLKQYNEEKKDGNISA